MGLRCLLGHDFGDVEVEREREEDGNEMVVTIREVKECNRCGKRRIVSENKEVTSIKTPEEVGMEADESEADEGAEVEEPVEPEEATHPAVEGEDEAEEFEPPESPEEDDGVILEEEEPEPERRPGEWPDAEAPQSRTTPMQDEAGGPGAEPSEEESEPSAETTAKATEDVAAVEEEGAEPAPVEGESEDVEIIDAESEADTAGPEATSEPRTEAETGTADQSSGAWPEHSGEDEGFDAEAGADDESGEVSFGGSQLTPEVDAEAPDEDAEFIDADGADAGDAEYAESEGNAAVEDVGGGHVSGPTTESTEPADTNVDTGIAREESASIDLSPSEADTEYFCPNCGMTRNSAGSSMRAGDICPECRKGYVTERDI